MHGIVDPVLTLFDLHFRGAASFFTATATPPASLASRSYNFSRS